MCVFLSRFHFLTFFPSSFSRRCQSHPESHVMDTSLADFIFLVDSLRVKAISVPFLILNSPPHPALLGPYLFT